MHSSATTVSPSSQKIITAAASSANRCAAPSPSAASNPENDGTNAALNAPSPNNRRNRFGNRLATKTASAIGPAPSIAAIRISRTKPSTRLAIVHPPTVRMPRNIPPPYRQASVPGNARDVRGPKTQKAGPGKARTGFRFAAARLWGGCVPPPRAARGGSACAGEV